MRADICDMPSDRRGAGRPAGWPNRPVRLFTAGWQAEGQYTAGRPADRPGTMVTLLGETDLRAMWLRGSTGHVAPRGRPANRLVGHAATKLYCQRFAMQLGNKAIKSDDIETYPLQL